MANSKTPKFQVDTKEFLIILDRLKPKEYKQAFKKSIRQALNILRKQAISNLRGETKQINKVDKYGNTLKKGIVAKAYKNELAGIVHIMANFKLRFFLNGTVDRYLKTYKGKDLLKKRLLGQMPKTEFFSRAKAETEREVYETLDLKILENIIKIYTGLK